MENVPRIFISYSHDSRDHKQWVAELSTDLRHKGIDVILDQWDLSPGEDVTAFIEENLSSADRVLVICTEEYVRKADAGEGGVGYERMIVTAELIKNLGTKKFIPVIRQASKEKKMPRFMGARYYINLSEYSFFDEEFKKLISELHKIPPKKPPLGKNPLKDLNSTHNAEKTSDLLQLPKEINDPIVIYKTSLELARRKDYIGWRQLVKQVRSPLSKLLVNWRKKYEKNPPKELELLHKAVDEAVKNIAPLLVIALTGVESRDEKLKDQRALFDDIYNITGWNYSGLSTLVELPSALGFVYQGLHGAIAISTGQIELAIKLVTMKISSHFNRKPESIWQHHDLMGWPRSLGRKSTDTWEFLYSAAERWSWLSEIFGSVYEFRVALIAYYMTLNIFELAETIAYDNGQTLQNTTEKLQLDIPLCFAAEEAGIEKKALEMLVKNPELLKILWERVGITKKDMKHYWPTWVQICKNWLTSVYKNPFLELHYANLFEVLE